MENDGCWWYVMLHLSSHPVFGLPSFPGIRHIVVYVRTTVYLSMSVCDRDALELYTCTHAWIRYLRTTGQPNGQIFIRPASSARFVFVSLLWSKHTYCGGRALLLLGATNAELCGCSSKLRMLLKSRQISTHSCVSTYIPFYATHALFDAF